MDVYKLRYSQLKVTNLQKREQIRNYHSEIVSKRIANQGKVQT